MKNFNVQLASVPDRENLVAEVFFGTDMVAELSNESSDEFRIEIYPARNGKEWTFDFEEFLKALQIAKMRLSC